MLMEKALTWGKSVGCVIDLLLFQCYFCYRKCLINVSRNAYTSQAHHWTTLNRFVGIYNMLVIILPIGQVTNRGGEGRGIFSVTHICMTKFNVFVSFFINYLALVC